MRAESTVSQGKQISRAHLRLVTEQDGVLAVKEELERARQIALQHLDRRAYSCAQLDILLAQHNIAQAVREELIERFKAAGLLDDLALACQKAMYWQTTKGYSKEAVLRRLALLGIEDQVCTSAVEQIDAQAELSAAVAVAEKRIRSMKNLCPAVQVRRITATLIRKGYSYDTARAALQAVGVGGSKLEEANCE